MLFDSASEARRAADALRAAEADSSLDLAIRAFVAGMRPRAEGDRIDLTLDGDRLGDPALTAAVEAKLKAARAR